MAITAPSKKKRRPSGAKQSASIEYHGIPGATRECLDAVLRLIQYGEPVTNVKILTSRGTTVSEHALLLTYGVGDEILINSGFTSGYGGEGPTGFSYILSVLEAHGAEIAEYQVSSEFIERCENFALLQSDLDSLVSAKPVRPARWYDYVFEEHWDPQSRLLWREFPPVIPFAIIDRRLTDVALAFWQNPNDSLLTGYKRLEDILRQRISSKTHGTRLLSEAFGKEQSKLTWHELDQAEHAGRAQLFTGAFMAFRNRRAHREILHDAEKELSEFILVNLLYRLEKEAIERPECD
jgi:hypothetical protein